MSRVSEYIFAPKDYLVYGDKKIVAKPLINTSLAELAGEGWVLSVLVRWCPGVGYSKLKYHFGDPDKKGYPFLVFKMWEKGNQLPSDNYVSHPSNIKLVKLLVDRDLTPNWTKHPSFQLPDLKETIIVKDLVYEDDLAFLTRRNAERLEELRKSDNERASIRETRNQMDGSPQRLVG